MYELLDRIPIVYQVFAGLTGPILLALFALGCMIYLRRRDLISLKNRSRIRSALLLMLIAGAFFLVTAHVDLDLFRPPRW